MCSNQVAWNRLMVFHFDVNHIESRDDRKFSKFFENFGKKILEKKFLQKFSKIYRNGLNVFHLGALDHISEIPIFWGVPSFFIFFIFPKKSYTEIL